MNPLPRQCYSSDLTEDQWAVLARLVLAETRVGRPIDSGRVREYLDATLYVLRTGHPWPHLPHDYEVNWSLTHKRLLRWIRLGVFDVILHALRETVRTAEGRNAAPSGAVVEGSSVKGSPVTGPRGLDGAKEIDGVKRHILVDTDSPLLSVVVTAANTQDRAVPPSLIRSAKQQCPLITKIWAEKSYQGPATRDLAAMTCIDIDTVSGPKDQTSFKGQPRR